MRVYKSLCVIYDIQTHIHTHRQHFDQLIQKSQPAEIKKTNNIQYVSRTLSLLGQIPVSETASTKTSLPKVIWEEGRVTAKVSLHWLQWRAQNLHPFPWTDPQTPLCASSLDPSDLRCQTASRLDSLFFHNALDRPTHACTDRQIVHGKV